MVFLEFKNVRITGTDACDPQRKVCNVDFKDISADSLGSLCGDNRRIGA